MKIKAVSAVLMSLVSGLAFVSPATAQQLAAKPCGCTSEQTCVGGRCLPNAIVPVETVRGIDTKSCTVSGATVACSNLVMPRKSFEKLIANQPPPPQRVN
jgi:hypothetical protein